MLPEIVSMNEWRSALEEQISREKAFTRARDQLNAQRRRLPMVKIDKTYSFTGSSGDVSLADLFEGRRQLIVYHFMFAPEWRAGCDGCSWVVDAMTHPAHLNARDTSLVLISRAPLEKLQNYQKRMGWQYPNWYSSQHSDFNQDMGATRSDPATPDKLQEIHGISVFLRDGENIYRTYFTGARGVEYLGSLWTYLDLTPYGRQEFWEDSPAGWPQTEPYVWNRRHDEYER